jgi:hypothetical protein
MLPPTFSRSMAMPAVCCRMTHGSRADGMLCSSSLVNVCLVPVSLRVDDRALSCDRDGFLHGTDAHLRVDLRAEADRHQNAFVDERS